MLAAEGRRGAKSNPIQSPVVVVAAGASKKRRVWLVHTNLEYLVLPYLPSAECVGALNGTDIAVHTNDQGTELIICIFKASHDCMLQQRRGAERRGEEYV